MKRFTTSLLIKRTADQRGDGLIIGIIAMSVLVLVAIGFFIIIASHKDKPVLTINQPKVTADDSLTGGNSNNELAQDVRILTAGNKRDSDEESAANATLADKPQQIIDTSTSDSGTNDTDPTDSTVQQSSLPDLQTNFGKEADRRIANLKDGLSLLPKLTQAQSATLQPVLNGEISAITGLKTRATTESTLDAFMVDKTNLDNEYYSYLLAISQVKLLVWADDQAVLEDKYNKLGGKYQDRLNTASSTGQSTAQTQIVLNNYQAAKVNAKGNTSDTLRDVPAIKAGDYSANRAILKTYQTKLSTAHDQLESALTNATSLTLAVQKLKQ